MARPRLGRESGAWDDTLLARAEVLLPIFLKDQRWFGGKGRRITRVRVADHASLRGAANVLLATVEVTYGDRGHEQYFLPLAVGYEGRPPDAPAPILRQGTTTVHDAFEDVGFCRALLRAIDRGAQIATAKRGTFTFEPRGGSLTRTVETREVDVRLLGVEQSNTSVVYGGRLILKAFRRLQPGVNPELEILDFLARHTDFDRVPALAGLAEYRARDGTPASLGVLQAFVPNEGDGWSYTLRELETLLDGSGIAWSEAALAERAAAYLDQVAELGRVTAGLHLALASSPTAPGFAPEPIGRADVEAWQESISARLARALGRLSATLDRQPTSVQSLGQDVLDGEARLRETSLGLASLLESSTAKTRHHGDYHLGQVLKTTDSFVILDFEGEPLRPLAERRARHTPLKDVAGMLRSFSYARHAAIRAAAPRSDGVERATLNAGRERLAASWERLARRAFLDAYLGRARAGRASFLPRSDDALRRALAALELEKALYELEYELDNRPDWLAIPLTALAKRDS